MATSISDGYTRQGFIKGNGDLHPDVKFSYRRILYDDRDEVFRSGSTRAKTSRAFNTLLRNLVLKHMDDWDLKYDANHPNEALRGKDMPLTEENLRTEVPSELWDRLYNIVSGREPSDLQESAGKEEVSDLVRELEAMSAGQHPGDETAAADAKN